MLNRIDVNMDLIKNEDTLKGWITAGGRKGVWKRGRKRGQVRFCLLCDCLLYKNMSRPLRIEYPDAWYHVMNRGCRSENIFFDDEDREAFIKVLEETADLWNFRIAAYCLMSNHYHLLLQTPDGNLPRGMRHINGVYTQRFKAYANLTPRDSASHAVSVASAIKRYPVAPALSSWGCIFRV